MEWIIFSLLAAVFTSLTTILAKIGIRDVNSNFATAYRTFVVVVCSVIICFISGSIIKMSTLSFKNYIFLILSGIATGCSWLCYYKALKLGDVNKIVPIDKCSFVLTSILFLIFFFEDTTKGGNPITIIMLFVSIILMIFGTILMIDKKEETETKNSMWLLLAILSAVFASLVSLFVKIGLKGIPSDLGTLIRTIIVLIFATTIVLVRSEQKGISEISKKTWIFLTLSGIATGGAWLNEYIALNMDGVNPIAVSSMSKLSILLTIAFSFFFLKEKLTKRALVGLISLVTGIVIIIIFSL